MAVRIPWDKYEAAILLDACLRVDHGEIERTFAITYVSNILRKRAEHRGINIDSIFRNKNGIGMQFSAMSNCLHHKSGGLAISSLFRETVELYESDQESFQKLVQEATELNPENEREKTFVFWLKEQPEYLPTAEKIIGLINAIGVLCFKEGVISEPITKMTSTETVTQLLDVLRPNKVLHIHSRKRLQEYIYAVEAYLDYLRRSEAVETKMDNATLQEDDFLTAERYVDFANPSELTYTRPDYFRFEDEDAVPVKNWTKLYVGIVRELRNRNSALLNSLIGKNISGATRIDFLNESDAYLMTAPYALENGLVIETNLKASDIVKKIRALLDLYSIKYESLKISYHKRNFVEGEAENSSNVDTCLESIWKAHYTEDISKLLEEHYAYGFRVGSPIEIMRFRNYAGNDNVVIPDSDEELEREINAAGTLIDGKIFVFGKAFLTELLGRLNAIFGNGIGVIFLEPFMEKNSEWLEDNHITNTELLREILLRNCQKFYYGQNMITQGERKTEQEAVVSEIHRVSGGSNVVCFPDLCEQLEYVPSEKIAWSLSASDDFVWISEGKYFVMRFFLIDDNEVAEICNYVASECADNGYASISDLPFGEIPEKNYELSVTALYSAVYIAVLKGHYNLNGKILTHEENSMDLCILLKKYCGERTKCTVTEVMEKAVELTGGANRQNSFVVLYDVMVRVEKNQFVSESQVRFDIDQIDSILQNIIGNRFAPIKAVTTFALFPTCGQNWNHYLLESFCYRFSRKYSLCVLNYNDKNAGIIVSKTLSLNYNDMLCEAAARADIELTFENVGKYFIESGLTARKKFASLPDIVKKAIQMRKEG